MVRNQAGPDHPRKDRGRRHAHGSLRRSKGISWRKVAPTGKVYQAGTLSGNPIATTAGIKTIELLMEDPEIYTRIEKNTENWRKLSGAPEKRESPSMSIRLDLLLSAFFTDRK